MQSRIFSQWTDDAPCCPYPKWDTNLLNQGAKLRSSGFALEQIYDAAFDDDALTELVVNLKAAFGARSALVHWIHADGEVDVLAHSRYYSDEQLASYARDFAAIDPWVGATAVPDQVNRANDLEKLVPVAEFTRSDFYNEYLRRMGDDTARCIGVRLENRIGSGFVALQRGLGQASFDPAGVAALSRCSGHLMRMLSIRGRLAASDQKISRLSSMIDMFAEAAFAVDEKMQLKHANISGEQLLRDGEFLQLRNRRLEVVASAAKVGDIVASALGGTLTAPAGLMLRGTDNRRLFLSISTMLQPGGRRLALVLASDPSASERSDHRQVQALFGLSAAEASIALLLTAGMSPREIADERRVAVGTVRFQIKQIAAKLGCRRQSEIVARILSLPAVVPRA